MSFYTSLSGLQAAQTDMSTISHNLANVSTNGFKKSSSIFSDVMASSLSADPRHLTGSGVVLLQNRQEFGEGNLRSTTSTLDLAISGDGFFAVKSGSGVSYTRNGSFSVDAQTHEIVDAQGSRLMAYPVDANGNVSATGADGLTSVRIPETSGVPVATSKVSLGVNLASGATTPLTAFNPANPSSYNNATATTVYDASGNPMTMTNYYVRDEAADAGGSTGWSVYSFVGDQQLTTGGATTPTTVTFDASGALTSPAAPIAYDSFTPTASGIAQSVSLDLGGSTSRAAVYSVASRTQDGLSIGQLSGVSINGAGVITATFSNGESKALGKLAVANFTDPTGLKQEGASYWSATGFSGQPKLGAAGESGFGRLLTGTIEGSNVDITEELVNLIAAQRNFQANAKALDTQSQISQTIFNIQ